jgi:cytochrome c553
MKLIKSLTLLTLVSSSFVYAQTTMCFKENHTSMTTIESTALDGGLCDSKKSVNDMKKDGWIIDDIKITPSSKGSNYIYIFKKDIPTISTLDQEKLEQRIMAKLEKRKKEEIEIKKQAILQRMSKNGKQIYIDKCQKCHGEKAEKRAYNTSRPLISLNLDDMQQSIRDYNVGDYNRGNAMVMKPYANFLTASKVKQIYSYIMSLRPKKDEKKKESK